MNYQFLSKVRYFVPGIMLYLLLAAVCWATSWCHLEVPTSWEQALKLGLAAVLSLPYIALGIRERMNGYYFDRVNRNLVVGLTEPFRGDPGVAQDLSWQQVRSTFYRLVNSDAALTHHSNRAFANGALWTSAADLRGISLIGVMFFILCLAIGELFTIAHFPPERAIFGMLCCLLLAAISFPLSHALTIRQIAIGNEQLEHIRAHHRQELRNMLSRM